MSDQLGEVMKATLTAIESGKEEIFVIAETFRTETLRLAIELAQHKSDISEIILQVNHQEKVVRLMRQRLMEVNRAHQTYTQDEMFETYS